MFAPLRVGAQASTDRLAAMLAFRKEVLLARNFRGSANSSERQSTGALRVPTPPAKNFDRTATRTPLAELFRSANDFLRSAQLVSSDGAKSWGRARVNTKNLDLRRNCIIIVERRTHA
jgi:hypothetical protein